MAYFRYKVTDDNNEVKQGMIQASTQEVAADILSERGLVVLSLVEESSSLADKELNFFNRVKLKDLVIFSRQLSVIISATIPLVQGLRILVPQTENPVLKTIISEVADDVEGGAKLSSSLSRHSNVFDDFFINIIKSGETSGKLDEVLNYLADQQEKDYDLTAKIKGAMIYPAFIMSGLFIVGILMMVFVVPQLTSILVETGTELPLPTKILVATSNFLATFWWLLLILAAGAFIGVKVAIKNPAGKLFFDTIILKLPVFGGLFQKIILVKFARSLHTLTTGGVPLIKSLTIVADVVGNQVYKTIILETVKEVEDGNSIATVFLREKEVPVMVSQMLSLGEKTGRLDNILDKLANFYSREVNNLVSNLVTLMEPLIMAIMGIAVGVLVSSIILPLYSLAASL